MQGLKALRIQQSGSGDEYDYSNYEAFVRDPTGGEQKMAEAKRKHPQMIRDFNRIKQRLSEVKDNHLSL